MYKFYPYFTNDGTVGLYSPEEDDIYHSTLGAATEAYEKFIFPASQYFAGKNKIKVLDICYGIGYNSKSFLNFIFQNEKIFSKNFQKNSGMPLSALSVYISKIDTDSIESCENCNDSLDGDNILDRNLTNHVNSELKFDNPEKISGIYIKAIDTDRITAWLAPFILSKAKKLPENYKLPFKNKKIEKLLNHPSNTQKAQGKDISEEIINSKQSDKNPSPAPVYRLINYPEALSIFLMQNMLENFPDILKDEEFLSLVTDKKCRPYFNASICRLFNFYRKWRGNYTPLRAFYAFLHNIYYKYLSNRYKNDFKRLYNMNINFDLRINDARREIKNDKNEYDCIFLDAFTPAKCPSLWTLDFFKLLFEHLDENGIILTYSNSAAVRSAFINAGFYAGKIYCPSARKYLGTIAAKNKSLISSKLSEYDLGLLKSKAGIMYRDENLNAPDSQILARRENEVKNSDLASSSQYIKTRNLS